MHTIALRGGTPVFDGTWPAWPQADARSVASVGRAVLGGRWTVSGGWTGADSLEREFARRFARFVGVPHAVTTDHGSSSLMVALEALGIGDGDEVVVPVLTWVATATAVLNVNAVPVFADVDADTGCLSADALEAALTPRTRAVIVVHLNCRMADMDRILQITRACGIAIVEDCAQAHGARWRGVQAGAHGDVGAFSMQQGKVLTCGEGGAVVTRDARLYDRLQQLRADGRRYRTDTPSRGDPALVETGELMGNNACLSELHAALLLDQLERLEAQVERRAAAAAFLDDALAQVPGLRPLHRAAQLDRPSVFRYAVRRDPAAFAGRPTAAINAALRAELGIRVHATDAPLHRNALYCPETKPRYRSLWARARPSASARFPAAESLYDNLILIPHAVLLAEHDALERVVEAFARLAVHADQL